MQGLSKTWDREPFSSVVPCPPSDGSSVAQKPYTYMKRNCSSVVYILSRIQSKERAFNSRITLLSHNVELIFKTP